LDLFNLAQIAMIEMMMIRTSVSARIASITFLRELATPTFFFDATTVGDCVGFCVGARTDIRSAGPQHWYTASWPNLAVQGAKALFPFGSGAGW